MRPGIESAMKPAFRVVAASTPVLATAIHAGHEVRPEVSRHLALDEATRRREEDPYTDRLIADVDGTKFFVARSRFEVDLNRSRDKAVYRSPDDAWGLDVWREPLTETLVQESLAIHDEFYRSLAGHLDRVTAHGPCLVLDVHSYNHRRAGPEHDADDPRRNPDVNVGTGALDRDRWDDVVDRFISGLREQPFSGGPLDVRENVKFEGGALAAWIAEQYPTTACVLAIEFKKIFMDEWTGVADEFRMAELATALATVATATVASVGTLTQQ